MTTAPLETPRALVSVGYEGRDVDQLIRSLLELGVSTLVDLRLNAISRKAGLSKSALRAALEEAGMNYLHLKALGNPRDNRESFRSGSLSSRKRFRQEMRTTDAQMAIEELVGLASDSVVALLCFEADHETCHRSCVVEELQSRLPALEVIRA